MSAASTNLIALLHGPDQPGIVARVAGWIFEHGGNIVHADQHRDEEAAIFFQRVEWTTPDAEGAEGFRRFAMSLGMRVQVADSQYRSRMVVMVSKADHCFHDLALRGRAGEFAGDIVGVISNHRDLEPAARSYDLEFQHVPIDAEKSRAEERQLELLREWRADVVVLARYMQVLSARFLDAAGCPVINIHHSFLPAFAGGRPYHQAHARGVKLIGATAHYVTPLLDDGPIIAQDVVHVTHRHGVEALIRKGRDLEKLVLAQAVRWHLEHRILIYNNKTVVFD